MKEKEEFLVDNNRNSCNNIRILKKGEREWNLAKNNQ